MAMRTTIQMPMGKNGVTLEKAFEDFILEKKVMKLAESTIKSYEGRFRDFLTFISGDAPCSDVTSVTIFKFVEYLQDRNPDIKTVSINTYLTHIRAILYSFMEKGHTDKFPIKLLKSEKDLIEAYSEAELERLLKKPDKNL